MTPSYTELWMETKSCSPIKWKTQQATVVRDGYLGCSTRVHFVEEQHYPEAVYIANAWVISIKPSDVYRNKIN